jgi:hypothetical protein
VSASLPWGAEGSPGNHDGLNGDLAAGEVTVMQRHEHGGPRREGRLTAASLESRTQRLAIDIDRLARHELDHEHCAYRRLTLVLLGGSSHRHAR